MNTGPLRPAVATALTVYGIETNLLPLLRYPLVQVATALTVYGIETRKYFIEFRYYFRLQQPLPFTVLKRYIYHSAHLKIFRLQQPLPFTVLKLSNLSEIKLYFNVATALTVYGIETDCIADIT